MAKQRIINIVYKVDKSQIDQSSNSVKKAEQATDKLEKQIKKTGDTGDKVFSKLKNLIGGIAIVGAITALGKKIFELGVEQEKLNVSFTTFLGSAERAKKVIGDLTKFSIVTPFTPQQVNSAAKALLAFGVQGEELIPILKQLGDVSAGTGKDLAELAVIFGQIKSTGRLMGQDLLQLINAGFNPLQEISRTTGKSVADLKKEMEKGLITFDMVNNAFKTATSSGGLFFDLMAKQSQTVGGIMSTIQGNIEEGFKNIFTSASGSVKEFVDILNQLSLKFLEFTKSNQQIADESESEIIEKTVKDYQAYIDIVGDTEEALQSIIKLIGLRTRAIENESSRMKEIANQEITLLDKVTGKSADIQREKDIASNRLSQLNEQWIVYTTKLIPAVNDYRESLNATEVSTKKAFVPPKSGEESFSSVDLDKQMQELEKFLDNERKAKKEISDLLEESSKEISDRLDEQYDEEFEKLVEKNNRELEEIKRRQDEEREIRRLLVDFIFDSAHSIVDLTMSTNEQALRSSEERYSRELELAGNNERAKLQIEQKREAELDKIRKSNFEKEKRAKRAHVLINVAQAIARAYSDHAYPLSLIISALAGGAAALQLAQINKARFAKGVIDLKGPGTGTSDSIPAMLSRGESVMTARETDESGGILKAIRSKKLDDKKLDALYKRASEGRGGGFDDSRIVGAIKGQKPPDLVRQGSFIYEVQAKNRNHKNYVRKKYLS